ncbi:MAG: hypothetical protein DRP51_08805 [Candidatus Zixiibacteriota bacterium]|nr:MAG: hypothetical protein DRP51_08805 [candidate division Zixibacteria bacterium]HHI01980.1 hypothetical protein [candidate division Zixibacteria bacterium]
MLKKVVMYITPKNSQCDEIKDYLLQQEISLQIRDIKTDPLERPEISRLLRHFDLKHFLNTDSKIYRKNRFDKLMPARDEIIDIMAGDNDLLRVPIIVWGRLMTVGCNREKIAEMLQIRNNGSKSHNDEAPNPSKINRRSKK